ncbi:MAG: ABC transporter ATP-binding protein [Syntrophobacterales bacterium]|nr:ABC transporter ATP-binding protein [Syntrophobacterales bacterium]
MIIKVEDIYFKYPSGGTVLNGISFEIKKGECVALLGVNGAGKSTLLKCINAILSPYKGVVYINGEGISSWGRRRIAQHIAYVPQRSQDSDLTVFEMIALGRKPYIDWALSEEDYQIIDDVITSLGLQNFTLKRVSELSGGEFQKVMIGRALAQTPDVFLMDEPTNHLDIKNQLDVMRTIRKITKSRIPSVATIVCLHDINLALRFADRLLFLKDGLIWSIVTPEELDPKIVFNVYGVPVSIVKSKGYNVVVPVDEEHYNEERNYPAHTLRSHYFRGTGPRP